MNKKKKIYLEYHGKYIQYRVIKLINRVEPKIGEYLHESDVKNLTISNNQTEVIITGKK